MPFLSSIGTPQGDRLSPVLFIVYLEAALKEVRDLSDKETSKKIKGSDPVKATFNA